MTSWNHEYRDPKLMTGKSDAQPSLVRLWKKARKFTGLSSGKLFAIDFGCGTGRFALLLAEGGADVYAFDGSSEAIAQARQGSVAENQQQITWVHHSWNDQSTLPQSSQSIDVVVMNMVLHLLSMNARTQAVREIFRVLKPGGIVLLRTFAREGDQNAKRLIVEYPSSQEPYSYVLPTLGHTEHVFSKTEIEELFYDFQVLFAKKQTGYPRMNHRVYKRYYWEFILQKA